MQVAEGDEKSLSPLLMSSTLIYVVPLTKRCEKGEEIQRFGNYSVLVNDNVEVDKVKEKVDLVDERLAKV